MYVNITTRKRNITSILGDVLETKSETIGAFYVSRSKDLDRVLTAKTCQHCNKPLGDNVVLGCGIYCSRDCLLKHD